MTTATNDPLEDAIRESGQGWLIDTFEPQSDALAHLRTALADINLRAQARSLSGEVDLSEGALLAEYRRNPQRVRAFFQAMGGTRTPDMLLMVWRIMQGMEISNVDLNYERNRSFSFEVVLTCPASASRESYKSVEINDAALLRHFGIIEVDQRPIFDGFYPLRVGR